MTNIYFAFSKTSRLGILVLIFLNLFAGLLYFFLPYLVQEPKKENTVHIEEMLSQLQTDSSSSSIIQLSPFDPNTLDSSGFQRLGLSTKLVQTIEHYRKKGGRFYTPESFRKVWGLKEEDYQRLLPFIQIKKEKTRLDSLQIHDLNTCDTSMLVALPGIGTGLATQIIIYRRLLGGFVKPEQLKEVWGINEETYRKIRPYINYCSLKSIRKININTATLDELRQHPYFRGELSLQIVNYRRSVNYQIHRIEELKSQTWLRADLFRKIAPYLSTR